MKPIIASKFIFTAILSTIPLISFAQSCDSTLPRSAAAIRYALVATNPSEVLDKQTGLIWQRCNLGQTFSSGQCVGNSTSFTWFEALKAAKDLGNGYRLPNIKELSTLIETACTSPAINQPYFPSTNNLIDYWSSTPVTSDGLRAWTVNFDKGVVQMGTVYYKSDRRFYVRAVRQSN